MSLSSIASFATDTIKDEGIMARAKRLDFYGAPKAEFRKGTVHGALMSAVAFLLACVLIARELQYSMAVRTTTNLEVDSRFDPAGRRTNVTFDIKFPRIACDHISISAEDNNGAPQHNVQHHVTKIRLDSQGYMLDAGSRHEVGDTIKDETALLGREGEAAARKSLADSAKDAPAQGGCGDCYGAGEPGECCDTCDEVKDKYRKMGWSFSPDEVPQCRPGFVPGAVAAKPEAAAPPREGCYLSGYLDLSKARGNVHFAPSSKAGAAVAGGAGDTAGAMLLRTFAAFNTTHTIDKLRFGENAPGMVYPLEGESRVIRDSYGMYQYYIKVVPTTYKPLSGPSVTTNQYSVTEHLKHVEPGSGRGLPGVYLYYELSTITASIEELRPGLLKFLTSVCAIVGGLYTVLGLIDHVITAVRKTHGLCHMRRCV
ncbi:endoplasmic reticulum vesicle transporter-domain-containing protein [Tribonema minus]|uniref:Endoplasmic reticulum vesicle transporter-domain-containing protein n=1 Tax=Tribonema minus TaxID=303371 RepID=A0A836C905_9STRA|nr:endoplasmic reticulum vesicle transporter-domain-containing protein [Tribonema minus]